MAKKKIQLSKIDKKINISDYSLKEYADYLNSFDGKLLRIETDKQVIKVSFKYASLPHLIGFQYAYDKEVNKQLYRGKPGMDKMLSGTVTFNDFERNVRNNHISINRKLIDWNDDIKPRIEWLPYFLNTVGKKSRLKVVDKTMMPTTNLKGSYYYFKNSKGAYMILSLLKFKHSFGVETFIVNNGIRFLAGIDDETVLNVSWESASTS